MALISKKKPAYKISSYLRHYLVDHDRERDVKITYADLLRYNNAIPLYDKWKADTLWETVFYPQDDMEHIYQNLKEIYAYLKAAGDLSVMEHLFIDRVDICTYGNTQPFRVRIVNKINDNFDYFYIKKADASRVYGLELEHYLSPNRISYITFGETLIEAHIAGIPGDQFTEHYLDDPNINDIRLAKEFIKFNERCFVRLLGDMHSSNFVIDITPDFEEIDYRIRAIDFDQQTYEGRRAIYLPQYFKQNNPLIEIGLKHASVETVAQYQKEERYLIATRLKASVKNINALLYAMVRDNISTQKNVLSLRKDLAKNYKNKVFLKCNNMGEILKESLNQLF